MTALASCLFSRVGRRHWRAHAALAFAAGGADGGNRCRVPHASGDSIYSAGVSFGLYLFTGHLGAWLTQIKCWNWRKIWVGVCLAALPCGLRYHPHHLAYFNELSGGPVEGSNHVLYWNIDWGQDLRELHEYLIDQKIEFVRLAYFGMVPPGRMGFHYQLPLSLKQVHAAGAIPPGWYAVSVNFVQGRPHTIRVTPTTRFVLWTHSNSTICGGSIRSHVYWLVDQRLPDRWRAVRSISPN